MEPNTQITIAQVVTNIVAQAAEASAIVVPIVYGAGEALKKIPKMPSWIAGFAAPFIGVLTLFLVNGFHFTSIGILVGILAGFGTAGIYSTVKSAAGPKDPSAVTNTTAGA